ncbi:MAG: M20/M25/M40 family metallo-hydrolase [Saprospiraceae bacterium]
MKSKLFLLSIFLFIFNSVVFAQIKGKSLDDLAHKYATESFDRLYELLSIPNDAHYSKDIERNIKWCEKEFQQRGFSTNRLTTETVPLLLAERKKEGADKTVLIYLQIDGQPVDKTKWFQESPWKPALKQKDANGAWQEIDWQNIHTNYDPELRVFARSTADSKGAANGFLAALDATKGIAQPNFNIKVIMDFEEELGSPELPKAVDKYSEELAADMLIIFDGPRHISNQPTLTFGARGISEITLTVFGPRTPQHSGHYGNYAPNPAVRLAQLIASMKDVDGKVTIPGFYDGIELDEATKAILAKVPDDEKVIQKSIGIAAPDKVGNNYQEAIQYPSLNVRGMRSGWVGIRSRTIVPATATAEIDVRLVMESDPEWLLGLVRSHIQAQGYYVVDKEPTEEERMKYNRITFMRAVTSYRAYRTAFDSTVGIWLDKALTRAFGKTPIKIRNSGGSIPIAPFVTTLGIPAVTVPIVNRDNNQHSPNENLRLGNYVDGVKTYIAVLTERL